MQQNNNLLKVKISAHNDERDHHLSLMLLVFNDLEMGLREPAR